MSDPTLIADLVRAGVDPDLIGRVANAIASGGKSAEIPVDTAAEKRRAYDRERKRNKRNSTGIPPESAECPNGHILTSLLTEDLESKEVRKKEANRESPRKVRASKSLLPESWTPLGSGPAGELTSLEQHEFEKLKDWARAGAIRKADWDATWRNWIRRARENSSGQNRQHRGGNSGSGDGLSFAERAVQKARRAAAAFESSSGFRHPAENLVQLDAIRRPAGDQTPDDGSGEGDRYPAAG